MVVNMHMGSKKPYGTCWSSRSRVRLDAVGMVTGRQVGEIGLKNIPEVPGWI